MPRLIVSSARALPGGSARVSQASTLVRSMGVLKGFVRQSVGGMPLTRKSLCKVTSFVSRMIGKSGRSRRSEEHTSELQSQSNLVCRLLLEKKKNAQYKNHSLHRHSIRHR